LGHEIVITSWRGFLLLWLLVLVVMPLLMIWLGFEIPMPPLIWLGFVILLCGLMAAGAVALVLLLRAAAWIAGRARRLKRRPGVRRVESQREN